MAFAAVILIPVAAATPFLLSLRTVPPQTGVVRLAVAQFGGVDLDRHQIRNVIVLELQREFRSFPEVVIQDLEGAPGVTNAQSAREAAIEEGRRRGANIIISGWYNQSKVVLYFDLIEHRAPPFCKEPDPNILPLDALENFDVSTPLKESMRRTVLLIAGIARMQANDDGAAIDRLTRVIASGGPNLSNIESAVAHYNRARCYYRQHNRQAVVEDATVVIQLYPGIAPVYLLRGAAHSELRETALALADFNTALRLDPDNACAEYGRGGVYLNSGSTQLALAEFDAAVKRHPTVEALLGRGQAFLALGQYSSAIADFQLAISRLKPSELLETANILLCRAYVESGHYKEALAAADRSLRIHVGSSELDARAVAWLHLREFDRAFADFARAIELEHSPSGKAAIYMNRGQCHFERGDFTSAIKDLTTAIQLDSTLGHAYNIRGLAEGRIGNLRSEIEDLTTATTLKDRLPQEIYNNLGRALVDAGETKRALKIYAEAIERGSRLAYGNRARLEFKEKNYPAAIEDLNTILAIKTEDIEDLEIAEGIRAETKELLYLRAAAHSALGQLDVALRDVDTLAKTDENTVYLRNLRGSILSRMGDKGAALRDFDYVLSTHPQDWEALGNRAWLLAKNGRNEQAIRDANSAFTAAPLETQGSIYDTRAYANLNLGKYSEAIADCKRAISLRSDIWYSYYTCGIAYARTGQPTRAMSFLQTALAHRNSLKEPGDEAMIAEAEREFAALIGTKR
jgi:tetratricopeptide (TPR) repeat protein